MRIDKGVYFDRKGRRVEIAGVSIGWAYTEDRNWFYADTGQSALKAHWHSDDPPYSLHSFPCDYDLIERLN